MNQLRKVAIQLLFLAGVGAAAEAQTVQKLSLQEAIQKGLETSKSLKLSKAKIEESIARYHQTKDAALPQAKLSGTYNHAYIPNNELVFPGSPNALTLPQNADFYMGTATVNQVIFAGSHYRYADASSEILKKIAELDAETQQDEVIYSITLAYCNLYKMEQGQKVSLQSAQEIEERIKETGKFLAQGLATQNDVLKWELEKSKVDLVLSQIKANLNVMNYNMAILLGMPEESRFETDSTITKLDQSAVFGELVKTAFSERREFKKVDYQLKSNDISIKSAKSGLYPTLVASGAAYYVNPSSKFIPASNTFLTPLTIGATLSYDIGSLYTFKSKVNVAKSQRLENEIAKTQLEDNVKMEVKREYESYLQALEKVQIVEVAVAQATENYRTALSRYNNSLANTTDKIDAETLLFRSKIDKELAKADASIAYYSLLKSMGTIQELSSTKN